ncbi:glutamate--tRNA ligase [soil metagenome]
MTTRCRIAPSPTGPLHIGTARTALFNYLFARQSGGTFILRLEDTDVARSSLEHERDILDGLHWLGLEWDEGPEVAGLPARGPLGPYRQSERTSEYRAAAERLLEEDKAYECFCTPDELAADRAARETSHAAAGPEAPATPRSSHRCAQLGPEERRAHRAAGRQPAIRFRVGKGAVTVHDIVRGEVTFDTSALGDDLVIVRSDGSPLYHFTVVVDDIAMGISHVIRGEDHLSNTPKHILLFRALGAEPPAFAHLPLILNPDRTKMSKRKSQTALAEYRAQGFIREALVNHLALMGWSSGSDEEVFSLDELVARFDLARVQPSGAIFDAERLAWLNGQWIRRLPDDERVERALPFLAGAVQAAAARGARARTPGADDLGALLPMLRERLPRLDAVGEMVDFVFIEDVRVDTDLLVPKRWDAATTADGLSRALEVIEGVGPVSFEADELEPALRALAEQQSWKAGDLFMAVRVAVTGRTATPPLFDTLVAVGPERTAQRLRSAIAMLRSAGLEAQDAPHA